MGPHDIDHKDDDKRLLYAEPKCCWPNTTSSKAKNGNVNRTYTGFFALITHVRIFAFAANQAKNI